MVWLASLEYVQELKIIECFKGTGQHFRSLRNVVGLMCNVLGLKYNVYLD